MTEGINNGYSNIKRMSDQELEKLWHAYFTDKSNKKVRDTLIVQYIYLTKNNGKAEESDDMSASSLMQLLGNKFGPPAGLTIEDFDYSLIQ